jgi:multiple antibiotic resistance protein
MPSPVWTYYILALTALLPLINPFGSALVFLGLVGDQPEAVYRKLARRVAFGTVIFLIVIEFAGAVILRFFGISLSIVQITGGLVIAATAWQLLFQKDASTHTRDKHEEIGAGPVIEPDQDQDLSDKIFYPFTFPITAGPGSLVLMLTLSAPASERSLLDRAGSHLGIALAVLTLSASVYFCYGYAPRLIGIIAPSTAHGILRVIAFLLLCLGVQLFWTGTQLLTH